MLLHSSILLCLHIFEFQAKKNYCQPGANLPRSATTVSVRSVNEGLSRNLWKPPETGCGGFRQVSVKNTKSLAFSAYISCKTCHSRSGITSDFDFSTGNLPETSAAGFWRFPDKPSLTDHTVRFLEHGLLSPMLLGQNLFNS